MSRLGDTAINLLAAVMELKIECEKLKVENRMLKEQIEKLESKQE